MTVATPVPQRTSLLPAAALLVNAAVWGTSWWPFRHLQAHGLHPLWATALIFVTASLLIVAVRPRALSQLLRTPALWVLIVAAGVTNASFNWAMVIGDVIRVVLLFYLMPIWSVVLARLLLGERFGLAAVARVLLALLGAVIVLWPHDDAVVHTSWSLSLADLLGLVGGFSFALNNVMLRREAAEPEEGRALAMFLGGAIVSGAIAVVLGLTDPHMALPTPSSAWLWPLAGLTLLFLAGNLSLQYGAARLPAQLTAVVMLTEVLFASVSAVWFGDSHWTSQLALGAVLIVASAGWAAISATASSRAPDALPTRDRDAGATPG